MCKTTGELQSSVITNSRITPYNVCEIIYNGFVLSLVMSWARLNLKVTWLSVWYWNCPHVLFSKSWRKSEKLSVHNWMEDMTTCSALWLHAWDWRRLMWKMPYWRGIRFSNFHTACFYCREDHTFSKNCRCSSISKTVLVLNEFNLPSLKWPEALDCI